MKLTQQIWSYSLAMVSTILLLTTSCEEQKHIPSISLEKVSTNPVKTTTSQTLYPINTVATLKGNIPNSGGTPVLECGAIYIFASSHSTNGKIEPTLGNGVKITTQSSNSSKFNISFNLTQGGGTYYIRLFATNSVGTVYSNIITLQTEVAKGEKGDGGPAGLQGANGNNGAMVVISSNEAIQKLPTLSNFIIQSNNCLKFEYANDNTGGSPIDADIIYMTLANYNNNKSALSTAYKGNNRSSLFKEQTVQLANAQTREICINSNDLTSGTNYVPVWVSLRYRNNRSIGAKELSSATLNQLRALQLKK